MRLNVFSIILFAVSCVALTVTTPSEDDKVDLSKEYEIKWRSVQSDPSKFSINLVNINGSSANKEIAKDVEASQGSVKVDKVWGIPKGTGYQLNFISRDQRNTGILAQSQRFEVTKVADPPKNSKKEFIYSSITTSSSSSSSSSSSPSSPSSSSSPSPASYTATSTKSTSRPCIKHHTLSSTTLPSSSTIPSCSAALATTTTSSSTSTTKSTSEPTSSTAGASSLAIPATFGSLMLSLFALML